jgi:hypothetical protein
VEVIHCDNCGKYCNVEPGDFYCGPECRDAYHTRLGKPPLEVRQQAASKPVRVGMSITNAYQVLAAEAASTFAQTQKRNEASRP